MKKRQIIIRTALWSRAILVIFQHVVYNAFPEHDAKVFQYPKSNETVTQVGKAVNYLLGGFLRWDAHYFMHIAKYGYTYENTVAFFPLYPFLVRIISASLSLFSPFSDSLLLLVLVATNVVFFVLSALCLYELSRFLMTKDLAFNAALLFCYNPASVFFTAPYSECIFSYLTFKSMLNSINLYRKHCGETHYQFQMSDVVFAIPVALSTITRSNGVLNIGFLVYALICLYLKTVRSSGSKYFVTHSLKFFVLISGTVAFCLLPFVLYQIYCYQKFCFDFETNLPQTVVTYAKLNNYVLPGTFSKHRQAWCSNKIPLAYSYVQSHYWNVGFLKYYEFKQIPNFLLALPLVVVISKGTLNFFQQFRKHFTNLFCFNLLEDNYVMGRSKLNPVMLVFVVHAAFLTVFSVLNIHVQVTTRMLCSASPVLYWFAAISTSYRQLKENIFEEIRSCFPNRKRHLIGLYFITYFLVGTILFSCNLPWT